MKSKAVLILTVLVILCLTVWGGSTIHALEVERDTAYRDGFIAGCSAHDVLMISKGIGYVPDHKQRHLDCSMLWANEFHDQLIDFGPIHIRP